MHWSYLHVDWVRIHTTALLRVLLECACVCAVFTCVCLYIVP